MISSLIWSRPLLFFRAIATAGFALAATGISFAGEKLPDGALPDAVIGYGKANVKQAWLARPTKRYDHAILGDGIEAGSLVAQTFCKHRMEFVLDEKHVFEDRHARVVDLEDDFSNEIVVIESNLGLGAALSVYGPAGATCSANGGLKRIARTPFIGTSNRWLNVAGIADYDDDGIKEIAIVVTPHIGGTLQFWSLKDGKMVLEAEKYGFSNHAIGSRAQGLSATVDTADGTALVVPGASRQTLHLVRLKDGKVVSDRFAKLHGRITENMAVKTNGDRVFVEFKSVNDGAVQVNVPVK